MIRAKAEGAGAAHAKKIEEAKPSGPHRKDTWELACANCSYFPLLGCEAAVKRRVRCGIFDNYSLEENRRPLPNGRSEARR